MKILDRVKLDIFENVEDRDAQDNLIGMLESVNTIDDLDRVITALEAAKEISYDAASDIIACKQLIEFLEKSSIADTTEGKEYIRLAKEFLKAIEDDPSKLENSTWVDQWGVKLGKAGAKIKFSSFKEYMEFIDCTNVDPDDVEKYMEEYKKTRSTLGKLESGIGKISEKAKKAAAKAKEKLKENLDKLKKKTNE